MLNLISWNVNGVRSLEAPIKNILDSFEADIICLQETKITRDQLDECTAVVDGYNSYFSFSKKRSGYSGVVTFCKTHACPLAAEEGLSGTFVKSGTLDHVGSYESIQEMGFDVLQSLDSEGRAVLTKHNIRLKDYTEASVVVINVYCPRADPEKPERKQFKLKFYKLLQRRAEAILKTGCHVIILGDINTSHKEIDHCDPSQCEDFSNQPERLWLNQFLLNADNYDEKGHSMKFIDSFRYFHPLQRNAFTCWNTLIGARQTNYGTRIDYIIVDAKLCKEVMTESTILADVKGSDHCPIKGVFDCTCLPSIKPPSLCSTYWPEFSGKQVKVSDYFQKCANSLPEAKLTSLCGRTENQLITKRCIRQKDGHKFRKVTSKQKCITAFINSESEKVDKPSSNGCNRLLTDSSLQTSNVSSSVKDIELTASQEGASKKAESAVAWKLLLKGPRPLPLCKGHNEPCVMRVVKKPGPNCGKEFYVCVRPNGHVNNPEAKCNHFQWLK